MLLEGGERIGSVFFGAEVEGCEVVAAETVHTGIDVEMVPGREGVQNRSGEPTNLRPDAQDSAKVVCEVRRFWRSGKDPVRGGEVEADGEGALVKGRDCVDVLGDEVGQG